MSLTLGVEVRHLAERYGCVSRGTVWNSKAVCSPPRAVLTPFG